MAFKRTAQCRKCGEVLLKIEPGVGEVTYTCKACNSEVATVTYDDYQTLLSTCDQCGGDTFKAKIIEADSNEYWDAECVNCKEIAKIIYMDNNGYIINEDKRLQLIKQDELNRLQEESEYKDDLIQILEKKVENLNYEIKERDYFIFELERKIKNYEDKVSEFENEIRDNKDYISGLEWKLNNIQ